MRRGISGIDIFAPRDNGLPDFANITPAQIFNGSAAASANAMEEMPDYPRGALGAAQRHTGGSFVGGLFNSAMEGAADGMYGGGGGSGYGGSSFLNDALGSAQRNAGGSFWGGVFNSAMEGARDGMYGTGGGYGYRGSGQRYTRIPGTGNVMEVRKAQVVPEYINGKAATDRGHRKINHGGTDFSFDSPDGAPMPQEVPYDLPGGPGVGQPVDPLVGAPPDQTSIYDPTDPMSANALPGYDQPAQYSQPVDDELNPNLFSPDYNEDESLFPPPDAIQMRTGAVNRLPTRLLEELKQLYRV